jgi:hypothetical protein
MNFSPLPLYEIQKRFLVNEASPSGLTWAISPSRAISKGDFAGTLTRQGYWAVRFNGKGYKAHRIVWALVNNADPAKMEIDHVNRNRSDNRIQNLRLVTRRENFENKNNQSKFGPGVSWSDGAFRVNIGSENFRVYLGSFDDLEKAQAKRKQAKDYLEAGGSILDLKWKNIDHPLLVA